MGEHWVGGTLHDSQPNYTLQPNPLIFFQIETCCLKIAVMSTVRASLALVVTLTLFHAATTSTTTTGAMLTSTDGTEHSKYLLPILLYGPNNQFKGLMEALVIAKLTSRTLVLPMRFSKWFKDDASPDGIVFDQVGG